MKFAMIFSFTLTGCVSFNMGDGMFIVQGSTAGDCLLSISKQDDSLVSHNIREVAGLFSQDFVVSPNEEKYSASLLCDNQVLRQKTFVYPTEIRVGGVLHL
ncbi:hypothetical protein ACJJIW_20750 [Microbulbifer sp. JMSA004]|uniref:hypothetical protein n=1 Tax=unclassified Microbulbifer TaxID=2619833 RepID=UPI0024AE49F0|nr:hypothetical protein [Microbulbifer sp. VAAF005]WHI46440.1 hypothetical protein P0078_22465 [Microbulbifer sp. VAAF005]